MKKFTIFFLTAISVLGIVIAKNLSTPPHLQNTVDEEVEVKTVEMSKINPALGRDISDQKVLEAEDGELTLLINIVKADKGESVTGMIILPKDENELGVSASGNYTSFTATLPPASYEIFLLANKANHGGLMIYYMDDVRLTKDSTITLYTENCDIETPYKHILPNGEVVKQDLYLTTPKEVEDPGNVRTGVKCILAYRHVYRDVSMTHTEYSITYQKTNATSAVTDTRLDPVIWVNTKNIPLEFTSIWRFMTKDGQVTMRYDIDRNNFGDTLQLDPNNFQYKDFDFVAPTDMCPPVANFDPNLLSGQAFLLWYNGISLYNGLGGMTADSADNKSRYWINSVPNRDSGYSFGVCPGIAAGKVSLYNFGYGTLPIVPTEDGIEYYPIQYLFPSIKVYAGSDGNQMNFDKLYNPRLERSCEETTWGDGFPFVSFYPARNIKPNLPYVDYVYKGNRGDQKAYGVSTSVVTGYTKNGEQWDSLWSGLYTSINTFASNVNKAEFQGEIKLEVVDSANVFGDIKGKSTSNIIFNNTREDFISPVINMLNVRNQDDAISNTLPYPQGATVELYAADMEFFMENLMGYKIVNKIKSAKVEVAPYGSDNYVEMPVKENPELENTLFWGQNFSASLDELTAPSETGYYSLRVTVEDPSGNTASVKAEPAFYLEALSGVEGNFVNDNMVITDEEISMEGALIEVYNYQGIKLASGKNQVSVKDMKGMPVIVKVNNNGKVITKKVFVK